MPPLPKSRCSVHLRRWQVLPWSKFIRTPESQRQRYQKATLAWKPRSLNDAFLPPISHLPNDYRLSRSLKMLLRLECLGWNSRSNLTDMRPGENGTTASRVPTTVSFCLSCPAPFCFYGPLCFCFSRPVHTQQITPHPFWGTILSESVYCMCISSTGA